MADSQRQARSSDVYRSRLEEFQDEWWSGAIPDVIGYITGSASHAPYFSELIEFDLKCRWKNFYAGDLSEPCDQFGFPLLPTLDDYASKAPPEYQSLILTPELLAAEYQVRNCWGDQPGQGMFIDRFPDDPDAVKNALHRVDVELEFKRLGSTIRPVWLDELYREFERAQEVGERLEIETFLKRVDQVDRPLALLALIEWEAKRKSPNSEPPKIEDYKKRLPDFQNEVEEAFARLAIEQTFNPSMGSPAPAEEDQITQIGPYRVHRLLGKGAFGSVFEASKPGEEKLVAVKVLRKKWVNQPRQVELFLSEARQTQDIRHQGVVTVLDVHTEAQQFYIVQELIEGCNLKDYVKRRRLGQSEVVQLMVKLSETLAYIHQQGIYHRDLKPANILIDREGQPHIADFGVAMQVDDRWERRGEIAGTLAYMSPEQIRGESHLVTASSDIWSLGVIFYELLSGSRPFSGEKWGKLSEEIERREPRGLREIDPSIPTELQRICLKCLAKEISRRYRSASDLLDDLKKGQTVRPILRVNRRIQPSLRPFEPKDHEKFLELLPGIRDAEGIPESIAFWKSRILNTDASTFRVGVLGGLSGSGKTSLLQAGLLPLLEKTQVRTLLIKATAEDTERHLFAALSEEFSELKEKSDVSLPDALRLVRETKILSDGEKLLIVLDQFEQWLYAHPEEKQYELANALRHCDGRRVQVLLCIRDGFMVSLKRFLLALDAELDTANNYAIIDLFDKKHAKAVLMRFGQGCDQLDLIPNSQHKQFLSAAVDLLAGSDDRIVCVQLVVFAAMMSHREWTMSELNRFGGVDGIGVQFLEDAFASRGAPELHRQHMRSAIGVLNCLLPATGVEIKGDLRSVDELQKAAQYSKQPQQFKELIKILRDDLRLITPVDPHVSSSNSDRGSPSGAAELDGDPGWYQLTHDYLVPTLRSWIAQKKQETSRGRAEVRLIQRTTLWSTGRESRQLPNWWEWIIIRCWVPQAHWTKQQSQMMTSANRYHARRIGLLGVIVALIAFAGYEGLGRFQASAIVQQLGSAEITEVPPLLEDIPKYSQWTSPRLRELLGSDPASSDRQILNYRLGLLASDVDQVNPLLEQMLEGTSSEVTVISHALDPFSDRTEERCWKLLEDQTESPAHRLRAASALAQWDPEDPRWNENAQAAAECLVNLPLYEIPDWLRLFKPCKSYLIPKLQQPYRSPFQKDRLSAAVVLSHFASDDPELLLDLIQQATPDQLRVVASAARHCEGQIVELFRRELLTASSVPTDSEALLRYCLAKSNAASVWLRSDPDAPVWHYLSQSSNPDLRSFLIHRIAAAEVPIETLLNRYKTGSYESEKMGIAMALGEYSELPGSSHSDLFQFVKETFRSDPDPGIHSTMEWLATVHGFRDELQVPSRRLPERGWQIIANGHTMAKVDPPESLSAGILKTKENDQGEHEPPELAPPERPFWIATKEVTIGQYEESLTSKDEFSGLDENLPVSSVSLEEAMFYCRWLSEQANVPEADMCYRVTKSGGIEPYPDYQKRRGFRLPTESEWECACRAQSETSRYFGELDALLSQYAWALENSNHTPRPVGTLRPNAFGLFDMNGNVEEWCQDSYHTDKPRSKVGVIRGGSFSSPPAAIYSARRRASITSMRHPFVGFRIACTEFLE